MQRIQTEEWENYLIAYQEAVIREKMKLDYDNIPALTEELFALYETCGDRRTYEDIYNLRRKYLFLAAMKLLMEKGQEQEEDLRDLEKILVEICRETCWALPAHVNRKEAGWEISIELFAAETAQALSEILSLLGAKLSPKVRKEVKDEVCRRVLQPFLAAKKGYWDWESSGTNWNAVCCGGIGGAALCLLQGEPHLLEQILERLCEDFEHYLAGFGMDGACMEGITYWEYGMSYFTMFARMLKDYTKGEKNLLQGEKCRNMMTFQQKAFFPGGKTLSFSDGSGSARFRPGLTCFLAMKNEQVQIPDIHLAAKPGTDVCYHWCAGYRDWLWTKEYVEALKQGKVKNCENNVSSREFFPDAQWVIFQGEKQTTVAARGGHNGESHNHNDVGSFLYHVGNQELVCDLGSGEYTQAYFGPERYETLCTSSRGHNVPLVNGGCELEGEEHGAKPLHFLEENQVQISFARAYARGAIEELNRILTFSHETGELTVEDIFLPTDKTETFEENLVSRQQIQVRENVIFLGEYGRIVVDNLEGEIRVLEETHHNHEGEKEKISLIRWQVPFTVEGGSCRYHLLPGICPES